MPVKLKVMVLSLLAGVLLWVTSAAVDTWLFYERQSFVDLLILSVPAHELYVRLAGIAVIMAFGGVLARHVGRSRQVEEALRHSEEQYRSVFENAEAGLFRTRISDGKILEANERLAQDLGYADSDELIREFVAGEHYVDEDAGEVFLDELRQKGQVKNASVRIRRKDGSIAWMQCSARLHPDKGYLEGVATDVTEGKRAAEALRESEQLLRATLESTADGILVTNVQGEVTHSNVRFSQMWGIPDELIQAGDDSALIDYVVDQLQEPEVFTSRIEELYQSTAEELDTLAFKDGRIFERFSHPLIRDGRVAGRVWSFRDVTQRLRDRRALEASEANYRAIFNAANDAIFVHDSDNGRILDVNEKACELFGYTREQFRNMSVEDISSPEPPYTQAEAMRRMREAAAGRPQLVQWRCADNTGRLFWVEVNVKMARVGGQDRVLAVVRDISRRKLLEEQFRQAQKMEAVGQLAGGVAHDFNNQMTVIKGYCDLLRKKLPAGADAAEPLAEMSRAVQRAGRVTSQLLAFSRKQVLHPEVINLSEVLSEMLNPLARMIGEKIQLSIIPDGALGNVKIDRAQVEQTIINLVVNARDAMTDGGKLRIEPANVQLSKADLRDDPDAAPGRYVMLAVTDTGEGMTPETMERIFEPFFTTKDVGKGTGLGLSMVYGFVRQSDGLIRVRSRPGRGTTFRIYLPRVDKPVRAERPAPPLRPLLKGTETILVAEDEQAVRQLVVRILRECGYTVLETGNAREAIPLGEHYDGAIDLLIADVIMPVMNGPELADRLNRVRPNMGVLYISGYPQSDMIGQGLLTGDVHLLVKPFSPDVLARRVRLLLDAGGGEKRAQTPPPDQPAN